MIAPNETNRHIRNRRAQVQKQAQAIQAVAQNTLNAVLWKLITHNAQAEAEECGEDFDGKSGVLTVPAEEIDSVPKGFALTIDVDPETKAVSIKAVVQKEKSNIILPDGGPIR